MEEDYVSYELAVKLKECGFAGVASGRYADCPKDPALFCGLECQSWNLEKDEILAPTLWCAWKWLRYEKNIDVEVNSNTENYEIVSYDWSLFWMSPCDFIDSADDSYQSYEEALEAGMMRAVEMLLSGEI